MSPEKRLRSKVTHLAPTGRTDTNREDGKEPRVNLAEPSEECEEGAPYTNEEYTDENEDLPVLELTVPQERPVLSVRLRKGGLESNEEKGQIGLTPLNQKSRNTNEKRNHNTSLRRKSV